MSRLSPNVTLAEQVAGQIRVRIASGEFAVGALIPTEMELTQELGVSRNSVREALRSLVHAGLLRSRAGYGTVVVATSDLGPALTRRVAQGKEQDLAEVRTLIEREAARLAAARATGEHKAELRDALRARADAADAADYVAADLRFHRALLDASGNVLLAELGVGTGGNEHALVHVNSPGVNHRAQPDEALDVLDRLHVDLVDAIDQGDVDAAGQLAEHLVELAHAPS